MAACAPGMSVAKLALEHGVNTNLLFKWRREYRAGKFGAPDPAHTVTEAVEKPAPVTQTGGFAVDPVVTGGRDRRCGGRQRHDRAVGAGVH